MRFIDLPEFGGAEVLCFGQTDKPQITDEQLLVKVAAIGVNRADILQRMGKYPPPKGESPILGLEICGEVVESADPDWLGKQVFGLVGGGAYAEYCVLEKSQAFELPDKCDVLQGAGIAEIFLTAYQAMFAIGELKSNQTVLIHAGASGVGTAAIRLAKAVSAKVVVTVGSEEKQQFCRALGADIAINYKTQDFVSAIKEQVPGGVNLVVDCIAGDYINRDINCMAMDSKIVVLAMMQGRFVEMLDMAKMLGKRITITASTLRSRSSDYKARLVADFKRDFFDKIESGKITPVIDKVFDWQDVEQAHRYIEGNLNKGKVVLKVS